MRLDFKQDDDSERQLSMVIRVGEVTATNPAAHKASVTFDDDDGQTSGELPVIVPNTIDNHDHAMPDVGEDVLCVFLPTGTEEGFILGSFYAGNVADPESSQDVRATKFKDDTRIAYDRSSHTYTIDIDGTHIKADQQKIEMESPQQIHLTTAQLLLTIGGTTMELNGSSAVINTSNITFTGNMDVTGTLHTSGNISTAGGVSAAGAVHGSNI